LLEYDKKSAGKNHILRTSKQHEILWEGKYMTLAKAVSMKYNKTIEKCSNEEIYYALLDMTKQMAEDKVSNEGKKKLYYISAEFLIGKLLSNNLINLGIYDNLKHPEKISVRSRRSNLSLHSEMADLDVWQHVS
jgi:glucan phosphorylase